jgi:acyl transferase domain-containing protein
MVVRTACSSSLVALHMACQDIRSGECSAAVVGGVNLILEARETIVMTEQGVLSPTGSCKSFDAEADGYARGEGVSAVYIKKLSNALQDGDPIRAVIRSTCVGGDGKTFGLTTPRTASHEKLMRRGHELAGLQDLSKTAMVECHGTGTPVCAIYTLCCLQIMADRSRLETHWKSKPLQTCGESTVFSSVQ